MKYWLPGSKLYPFLKTVPFRGGLCTACIFINDDLFFIL